MKTFVRLFVSSAVFGAVIAIVYYVWSKGEWSGTILLGCMALGLTFALTYAIVAERDAQLHGDREGDGNRAAAGEDLGIYTTRSPWPLVTAFSVLLLLLGALWVPFLIAAGTAGLLFALWRMASESGRI